MEFAGLIKFLGNNFLFSTVIILITFILGWILYNHVVIRGICLKDALFEKDNLAAWVEFIGAFIYPALYLAAKSIEGSASDNILLDLLICVGYVVSYVLIFTVLRLLAGTVVKLLDSEDHEGKISLNSEIYSQKNIAAALFSSALSIIFVNVVKFLDILPGYFLTSVYKMLIILLFTLIALVAYMLLLRNKTTLFKEIFIDNNIAAGVCFAGFVFAVQLILGSLTELQVEFDFAGLLSMSAISLVLFGVLSILFKWLFTRMIKVDVWKEVYEQNNIGAALGQIALYVGIANVIVHFIK